MDHGEIWSDYGGIHSSGGRMVAFIIMIGYGRIMMGFGIVVRYGKACSDCSRIILAYGGIWLERGGI